MQIASGGVLFLHGQPVESNIDSLPEYPVSRSKELLLKLIHKFPRIKAELRRCIRSEPDFFDPSAFQEVRMGYFRGDLDSIRRIFSENWSDHATARREKWCAWSRFASKNGMNPIWTKPHPESCPWVLPVYVPNAEERKRWLHIGWLQGVDLFPWPALPKIVLQSSPLTTKRWKNLLCFPLHQKFNHISTNFQNSFQSNK